MKPLHIVAAFGISVSMMACAAADESEGQGATSSADALSTPSDTQHACAAASTYDSDGPSDFDAPADSDIPAAVNAHELGLSGANRIPIAHFQAPTVGDVYALGAAGNNLTLYDVNGSTLAAGVMYAGQLVWYVPNGTAKGMDLDCSGTGYDVPTFPTTSSGAGDDGTSSTPTPAWWF